MPHMPLIDSTHALLQKEVNKDPPCIHHNPLGILMLALNQRMEPYGFIRYPPRLGTMPTNDGENTPRPQ